MHLRHRLLIAVAALAFGVSAGTARAEDFTLIVRVDLANLPPETNSGSVQCYLLAAPSRSDSAGSRQVGVVAQGFPITGGAYGGDVTLRLNAAPGVDPAQVTHYQCFLVLRMTLRGVPTSYSFQYGMPTPPLPVAPGAAFTPVITAPVP